MSEKFESWAVVELFGHQKIAGRVSEQQIAGSTMLRIDVPEAEGQTGFTRFYGGNAVYSITPTDEVTTRRAVEMLQARPITIYGVIAPERQIEARLTDSEDDYPDEDDEDSYDVPLTDEEWEYLDNPDEDDDPDDEDDDEGPDREDDNE